MIGVLSAIIKYLIMTFCCLSVTFLFVILFVVYVIGMVRSEKK